MNPLLKKLNFKDHNEIIILNPPQEFVEQMKDFGLYGTVLNAIPEGKIQFVMVFVTKQVEVDELTPKIEAKLDGDAVVWFVYPKGTSKRYKCDFNRDTGWQIMGKLGLESVRMVAVDEDWSALRFRKVEYVKVINRDPSWIATEEGKAKAKKQS
jgi:hypothetical protein